MIPLAPGQRVTWLHQPPRTRGRHWARTQYPYLCPAQIVAVGKATAKIRVRRADGRLKERYVKLDRLRSS